MPAPLARYFTKKNVMNIIIAGVYHHLPGIHGLGYNKKYAGLRESSQRRKGYGDERVAMTKGQGEENSTGLRDHA